MTKRVVASEATASGTTDATTNPPTDSESSVDGVAAQRPHLVSSPRVPALGVDSDAALIETLRSAIRASGIGVWIWELDSGRVYFSSKMEEICGFGVDSFGGQFDQSAERVHPEDHKLWRDAVDACLNQGAVFDVKLRLLDDDGTQRWVQAIGDLERDDSGRPTRMVGTGRDIEDEQRVELERRRVTETLEKIAGNLSGALFEYVRYPDLSDSINYMNPGCTELWELQPEEVRGDPSLLWQMILPEDLPQMSASVEASERTLCVWNSEFRIRPRSGKVKWLRAVGSPTRLDDGGTSWTTILIDVTEAKRTEEASARALKQTVSTFARALEIRSPNRAGHEKRVAGVARLIAQKLGLSEHDIQGLELACMLHDIGKIMIPVEILNKPGSLTRQEQALLQGHVEIGAELIGEVEFDWPVADIVAQHQENWDGSGYPDARVGEDILLEARILRLAAALEALVVPSPFRTHLSMAEAAQRIRDDAGKRFDPEVVAACLELLESGQLDAPLADDIAPDWREPDVD